jgi:hypothetical protein
MYLVVIMLTELISDSCFGLLLYVIWPLVERPEFDSRLGEEILLLVTTSSLAVQPSHCPVQW